MVLYGGIKLMAVCGEMGCCMERESARERGRARACARDSARENEREREGRRGEAALIQARS